MGPDTPPSSPLDLGKIDSNSRGPTSLCNTHHEQYKKKILKLNRKEYPELSAPINIDKNTELEYFSEFPSIADVKQFIVGKRKITLDFRPKKDPK